MQNKKILIFGGSGQIGKELSLYFNNNKNIKPVFHARTKAAAAFLINKNNDCIICEFEDQNLKKIINEADLVFNLVDPIRGSLKERKYFYQYRIEYIINNMHTNAKFVFASSMLAFGFGKIRNKLKNYFLAGSLSGASKRFAENFAIKMGKKKLVDIYTVRFSEVHGTFQRVTQKLKKIILKEYIFEIPKKSSCIVFIPTIYEMLLSILNGNEKPGKYTLTNDQIFWKDLLDHLGRKVKKKVDYKFVDNNKKNIITKFVDLIYKFLLSRKDLINQIYSTPKSLKINIKLNHTILKAKNASKQTSGKKIYTGIPLYEGILPGKRFQNLTLEKELIFEKDEMIENKYNT